MFTMLSTIYFLIGLGQVVLVRGSDCQCGKPSDSVVSMRIVGGRRAAPHSFPWTVAILKNDRMHCGGAMITNKHVLSAGHCFKWDNFATMEVLIGLDNLDNLKNVEKRNISNVVIHELFTSTAVRDENDIAIATLNQPVAFNDNIVPICLPQAGEDFTNRIGTIVGWGRIGVEKSSSKVLLKASLRILSDEDCMNSQLAQHLKPTMMCAFSKGKDGCQGDSGGPLLVFQPEGKYVQSAKQATALIDTGASNSCISAESCPGASDVRIPGIPVYFDVYGTFTDLALGNKVLPWHRPGKHGAKGRRPIFSSGWNKAANDDDELYEGVYTKVSNYIDWIVQHTPDGIRCA